MGVPIARHIVTGLQLSATLATRPTGNTCLRVRAVIATVLAVDSYRPSSWPQGASIVATTETPPSCISTTDRRQRRLSMSVPVADRGPDLSWRSQSAMCAATHATGRDTKRRSAQPWPELLRPGWLPLKFDGCGPRRHVLGPAPAAAGGLDGDVTGDRVAAGRGDA